MIALLIAALLTPPCVLDASKGLKVECKYRLTQGEEAPFTGVLITDKLSIEIQKDIKALETAYEAQVNATEVAREERDQYVIMYANALRHGDKLEEQLQENPARTTMWVTLGFIAASLAFVGGMYFGKSL